MSTFTLILQDSTRRERVDDVESFVGKDSSGSFGILAGHVRFMTVLGFGLARFRRAGAGWEYLALPGGLAYMRDNELFVCTRRYLRDTDYARISSALEEKIRIEERELLQMKESLKTMEETVLRRLWELGQKDRTVG